MLQSMPEVFQVLEDDTRRAVLFALGRLRRATVNELCERTGCDEGDLLDQLRHLEQWELIDVNRSADPWIYLIDSSVSVDETSSEIVLTLLVANKQRLQLSLRKDAGTL